MGDGADQLGKMAFTYRWYRRFLQRMRDANYVFRRFDDTPDAGDVLLRHDVDLSPESAVRMARIESEFNVQATYFVRVGSSLYNPFERRQRGRLEEIHALGHDIGLHFSTHEYWDDEPAEIELETEIQEEQFVLDSVVPELSRTVSFHVPPKWTLHRAFDMRTTYAPRYFSEIGYVADGGQRWRETPPNPATLPDAVQILVHPGLWGESDAGFEARVERAIARTCRDASRDARQEFLSGAGTDDV